ncbi:MAG: PqqD family protein [Bacteroidota bacterium]
MKWNPVRYWTMFENDKLMMDLNDIVEANNNLMMADLEGEAVLLNIQTGRYFGLNDVGTTVWSLLKTPCTIEDILLHMQGRYEVSADALREDILQFLADMEKRNLIRIVVPANA